MNQDIRQIIREARIYQWEVAEKLGIAESTLIRWLRFELPEDKRAEILKAIDELKRKV